MIHSTSQNLIEFKFEDFWIGGNLGPGFSDQYQWEDNSKFDYTNWRWEPTNYKGHCLNLDETWDYKWGDTDCDIELFGFICKNVL